MYANMRSRVGSVDIFLMPIKVAMCFYSVDARHLLFSGFLGDPRLSTLESGAVGIVRLWQWACMWAM